MNKREQTIAICVGAAIGLFGLDRFVITPLMAKASDTRALYQKEATDFEIERGKVNNRAAYQRKWEQYKAQGLLSDGNTSQQEVARYLKGWADEQELQLGAFQFPSAPIPVQRPDGKPGVKLPDFFRVSVKFAVTGRMAQIANFLSHIQHAEIPIRISEMTISTKSEGFDAQELSLTVSSLIMQAPGSVAARPPSASQPARSTSGPAENRATSNRGG